jgi:NTP pyrophosphatase (non-canonical NTP hydrolase)
MMLKFLFKKFVQDRIGKWAEKTFIYSTPKTIIAHLKREIKELDDAVNLLSINERRDYILRPIAMEIADCVMLLIHLAFKLGIHLLNSVFVKFEIVKKREWLPPDAEGVQVHKK